MLIPLMLLVLTVLTALTLGALGLAANLVLVQFRQMDEPPVAAQAVLSH